MIKNYLYKFSIFTLTNNLIMDSGCSICLIPDTSSTYNLECNHSFCNKCITQWLLINDNCPCCRKQIIETNSETDENDDTSYNFSILIDESVLMQPDIEESVSGRVEDIINIQYFSQHPNYNWTITEKLTDCFCTTYISKHNSYYKLTLNLYQINNTHYVHIENIVQILKNNKKENTIKNQTQKWRFKQSKNSNNKYKLSKLY